MTITHFLKPIWGLEPANLDWSLSSGKDFDSLTGKQVLADPRLWVYLTCLGTILNSIEYAAELVYILDLAVSRVQNIDWFCSQPSPIYSLILQWTHPIEFSIVYKHVKWPLCFTLMFNFKTTNIFFKTTRSINFCDSINLHSTQGRLL